MTARKKGKATITAMTSGKVLKVKLVVKAAKCKPVALGKLQCYEHFRRYVGLTQFRKAYQKAVSLTRPLLDLTGRRSSMAPPLS